MVRESKNICLYLMSKEDKKKIISEEIVLTDSGSSVELFSNPGKVRVVLSEEKDKNGSVSLRKFVTLDFKKVFLNEFIKNTSLSRVFCPSKEIR